MGERVQRASRRTAWQEAIIEHRVAVHLFLHLARSSKLFRTRDSPKQ